MHLCCLKPPWNGSVLMLPCALGRQPPSANPPWHLLSPKRRSPVSVLHGVASRWPPAPHACPHTPLGVTYGCMREQRLACPQAALGCRAKLSSRAASLSLSLSIYLSLSTLIMHRFCRSASLPVRRPRVLVRRTVPATRAESVATAAILAMPSGTPLHVGTHRRPHRSASKSGPQRTGGTSGTVGDATRGATGDVSECAPPTASGERGREPGRDAGREPDRDREWPGRLLPASTGTRGEPVRGG